MHPGVTRLQVSGYRFLLRRIECALLGRDVRDVNEPIRASLQSLMAGAVLAIVMVAGCALLAAVGPQPGLPNASIVMGKQSGALYVRIGETLHPVLNLASARLITRTNADPQPVPESDLSHSKRGLPLGIPGAPQFLGIPLGEDELRWTVCDSGGGSPSTTIVIGSAEGPRSQPLAGEQSVLVKPVSGGSTYLLYDGRRAVVNLNEPAVVRALGLDGRVPLAVSSTLLNAVSEAPPITTPRIADVGTRGSSALPGFTVGSVLRVARADRDEYYVVVGHGIQRIGRVVADLLRFTDSRGARTVIAVAPDFIRSAPTVTDLPVATFPDRAPTPLTDSTTLCVGWRHGDVAMSAGGPPIPAGQEPVKLSQADGNGPALDAVYLSPGHCAYVRATGLSGSNPQAGTRYLITDTGVRFAIHDDDAAHDLGLPDTAIPAPWPLLAKLPAGPELSRANASVAS
ncbi:type VII secretion protein EccB [Candidatus Mycobacterium methanotrophicum]|uniref:Type VII secretion protein EccB n=1 Tax=Candidatus Mycobacterium methanotrophicum TaxID=2943498 RepID=A0ABY4QL27_9MYCO|nr:type VII secretion protein EccB [Candidatus Mycobacterium methanotrophicum]UQX10509.1 type VII secretion protein EccB [Candidatus Mycobacterium methanotrophicum]